MVATRASRFGYTQHNTIGHIMPKNDPYAVEVGATGFGLWYGVARFTHEPSPADLRRAQRTVRRLVVAQLELRNEGTHTRLTRIDADAVDARPGGAYRAAWIERA